MTLFLLACWPGPLPACDDCALHDDVDGDGVSLAQGDCDDTDPAIGPHLDEVCDNGIDDDCDGGPGPCRMTGLLRLDEVGRVVSAENRSSRHGTSLATSHGALWVGAPNLGGLALRGGLVHLGSDDERLTEAADTWIEGGPADRLGLTATQTPGALWGRTNAFGAGAVHRIPTPVPTGTLDLADVRDLSYTGADGEALGELALVGDPSGGLLISSSAPGRLAWWVASPSGAPLAEDGMPIERNGTLSAATVLAGAPVVGVATADVDGANGAGRVWLHDEALASPAVELTGPNAQDRAGAVLSALPDLDGDGVDELFVGGAGVAGASGWLVAADTAGGPLDAASWATLVSEELLAVPQAVAAIDLDRDGVLDLVVGAPTDSRGGNGAGALFVFYGPLPAVLDTEAADVVLLGTGSGAAAGATLAVFEHGGEPVLAVGQPGDATLAEGAGGVVVVQPRGL